jgi:hypothetical protein
VALEEEEAALGLGPFFWLSWQAFLYPHWCRLLVLLSMGGLVGTPLVELIAMGWKLSFHTVVVVRCFVSLESKTVLRQVGCLYCLQFFR